MPREHSIDQRDGGADSQRDDVVSHGEEDQVKKCVAAVKHAYQWRK